MKSITETIAPLKNYLSAVTIFTALSANAQVSKLTNYISLNSIETSAKDDFSDLMPLVKLIGNSTVVALGEPTHENGSALKAKVRLVKFLHEKMGFDVLLFEYAFLGGSLTDEKLGTNQDLRTSLNSMNYWISSEVYPDLHEYIRNTKNSSRPMTLGGFDCEKVPQGISDNKTLFDRVVSKLPQLGVTDMERIYVDSLIRANGALGNAYGKSFTNNGNNIAIGVIKRVINAISGASYKSEFTKEEIVSYPLFLKSLILNNEERTAGGFWNIVRDKNMATRFHWHYNTLHPSKKFILWGATAHFSHDMVSITRQGDGFYPYYQMGDYLKNSLGDDYYVIAITSYQGKSGVVYPENSQYKDYTYEKEISTPPNQSFESLAHASGNPYLFIDLRSLPRKHILRDKLIATPLGHQVDFAEWGRIIDAFLFIDTQVPVKY